VTTDNIKDNLDREEAERELLHLEYESLQTQVHALGSRFRVIEMAQKLAALRGDIHGDEISKLKERFEHLRASMEGLTQP
jgi:predicted nuclease with TOPRIM domain